VSSLASTWPAFSRWWREGANARPTEAEARARLEEYMPELVPAWERLTGMITGPGAADASGSGLLASGSAPLAVTRRNRLTLHLTRGHGYRSGGYHGVTDPDLTVVARRTRIHSFVWLIPGLP